MASSLLHHAKYSFPIRSTNKDFEWHPPPTIDDLFECFINNESLTPDDTYEAYGGSPQKIDCFFEPCNTFDEIASAPSKISQPTSPGCAIEVGSSQYPFGHNLAISATETHLQAPASSPNEESGSHNAGNKPPRGSTVSSDDDILTLVKQLQDEAANRSVDRSPVLVSSPLVPMSVPAQRVIDPQRLTNSLRSQEPTRPRLANTTAPPNMNLSEQRMQALWARRVGSKISTRLTMGGYPGGRTPGHPINLALDAPGSTPVQCDPDFLHDYRLAASYENPNNAFRDEIEPLSPFTTAYANFPPSSTPLSSPGFGQASPSINGQPTFNSHGFDFGNAISSTPQSHRTIDTLLTPPPSVGIKQSGWVDDAVWQNNALSSPNFTAMNQEIISSARTGNVDFEPEAWWQTPEISSPHTAAMPATNARLFGLGIDANTTEDGFVFTDQVRTASPLINSIDPVNLGMPLPAYTDSMSFLKSPPQLSPHMPRSPYGIPQAEPVKQAPPQLQSYKRHQRHHTVGTPTSLSQMSLPIRPTRTTSGSPTQTGVVRNHRRSKSSHFTSRRKSVALGQARSTSSAESPNVGFVNYTPHDSKKILTGVAPSGSSKTKARREKEAAEKRRKLSEAAKKAVLEAGGDIGLLEKEGLFGAGEEGFPG